MAGWLPLFAPITSQAGMQIGMNLNGVIYYTIENVFTDVFKYGAGWFGGGNGTSQFCDLDSNGWPLSMNKTTGGTYTDLTTFIYNGIDVAKANPIYKPGDYVVLKTGTGTVSYGYDASIQSSTASRDVIRVTTPQDGFYIRITAITSGPMTFRVCHIDDEAALVAGTLTNPGIVSRLAPFNPIRYMDWGMTNVIDTKEWSERTPVTFAFYGDTYPNDATPIVTHRSVPIEIMVQFSNENSKDMWICMPFGASDDYMEQCATYVLANLNSDLKCYVEYANECWNVSYGAIGFRWDWMADFMTAADAAYPAADSDFTAGFGWSIVRSVVNADIWKTVWAGETDRLICVMASQASYDDRVRYQLEYEDSRYFTGQAGTHFDALATAPYFGSNSGDNSALTETQLFQEIDSGGTGADGAYPGGWIKESSDWAVANKLRADAFGLDLLYYEGGQHFTDYTGTNVPLQTLYEDANIDPRMQTSYTNYLQKMEDAGGTVFCNFNFIGLPSKFGYWGALPEPLATSSPKYDALVDFAT